MVCNKYYFYYYFKLFVSHFRDFLSLPCPVDTKCSRSNSHQSEGKFFLYSCHQKKWTYWNMFFLSSFGNNSQLGKWLLSWVPWNWNERFRQPKIGVWVFCGCWGVTPDFFSYLSGTWNVSAQSSCVCTPAILIMRRSTLPALGSWSAHQLWSLWRDFTIPMLSSHHPWSLNTFCAYCEGIPPAQILFLFYTVSWRL